MWWLWAGHVAESRRESGECETNVIGVVQNGIMSFSANVYVYGRGGEKTASP